VKEQKKKSTRPQKEADAVAKAFVAPSSFRMDPLGSYTGHPEDKSEKPVQDADDL
jgi:hypothetical protein